MFRRFVVLLLLPLPLAAQEGHPLDRLVAEALRGNRTYEIERIGERRSADEVRAARAMYFPALALDSRYSEQEGTLDFGEIINPAFAALNELRGADDFPTDLSLTLPLAHETRLRITQPLFDESIRGSVRLARHREVAQRERREAAARWLAAEVQVAYLSFAAARKTAAIHETTLNLVRENERTTRRLLDAGRATPDAVYRARAERSDVEQQLAEAREQVDVAARAFNHLLGRPLNEPIEAIPDSALHFDLAISEEAAVVRALARREELTASDAGIGAADAAVSLATAAFLPSVAVALDYGVQGQQLRFGPGEDYWIASVVVSWGLSAGGGNAARHSAARADADAARVSRRDLEERIRLEVRQAHAAAVVARDAIATADDRLAAARASFDLVRRRYEEGLASQIELIDARTQLTSAELNRTLTQYRYAIRFIHLEHAAALRDID